MRKTKKTTKKTKKKNAKKAAKKTAKKVQQRKAPAKRSKKDVDIAEDHEAEQRVGWKHVGGGCMLIDPEPRCDDEYRHTKTGVCVWLKTTSEAHFQMPAFVRDIAEVEALPGVKRL